MKFSNRLLLLILTLLFSFIFFSCGNNGSTGDIPKSTLSIPGALTPSASRSEDKATSAEGTSDSFFEPFRSSLKIAEDVLGSVNSIIDSLNAAIVPDQWTGTDNNGDNVTVTTDSARDYSKRIEFTSIGSTSPYLQINYTPGEVKGIIYYTEEDQTESLEKIKVFYDETEAHPILKGWMSITPGDTGDTYPVSLYFNATKNTDGNIVFEGGVSYNFVFGGHTTYSQNYTGERSYMFKAVTNSSGTKAKVALYFPLSSSTTVDAASDIKNSFLDILFEWLETENGEDLDVILGQSADTITNGTTLGTVLISLEAGSIPDNIGFVLNLTNPIAYSDVNGYEGNDSTYPDDETYALGDLGTIDFSLNPAEIEALKSSPESTFAFLSD